MLVVVSAKQILDLKLFSYYGKLKTDSKGLIQVEKFDSSLVFKAQLFWSKKLEANSGSIVTGKEPETEVNLSAVKS